MPLPTFNKYKDYNEWWHDALMGKTFESRGRKIFKMLPARYRCKFCYAPFSGLFAPLMRMIKKGNSKKNNDICQFCEEFAREHMLGAEIELSMMFADVRGSTALAERMAPREFTELMNSFFRIANSVLIKHDALIDKMVGDEVIGLFVPGLAGKNHPEVAIHTAMEMAERLDKELGDAKLPIGTGVHTGLVYIGAVGSKETSVDVTAMGDNMNTTARLASTAKAGEILISEACLSQVNLRKPLALESREVHLKGKSKPLAVHSLMMG